MNGHQRTRVWLAAVAAVVALAGTLVTLFATDTIGGDRNECRDQSVCGHGNTTNFGVSTAPTGTASEESAR
ncbi:hypothetical protein ACFW3D_28745 [Streptomyces sp. NPDC058864]